MPHSSETDADLTRQPRVAQVLARASAAPEGAASRDGEALEERLAELGLFEDREVLVLSLHDYLEGAGEALVALDEAHEAGDSAAAARFAHRLAGSSLTIGAEELGRAAARLEKRLEDACTTDASSAAILEEVVARAAAVFAWCRALASR